MQHLEGDMIVREARIAVVVSRFNEMLTQRLLDGAVGAFRRHGGDPQTLVVAHVPGTFELPVTAQRLAASGRFDAVICLGCVIRGATGHYDHVAGQGAGGILNAATQTQVPVIFGVITADTLEQAIERSGTKQGNQGDKAMLAAIEMANLMRQIDALSREPTEGHR